LLFNRAKHALRIIGRDERLHGDDKLERIDNRQRVHVEVLYADYRRVFQIKWRIRGSEDWEDGEDVPDIREGIRQSRKTRAFRPRLEGKIILL
jgi:hypothetical protein